MLLRLFYAFDALLLLTFAFGGIAAFAGVFDPMRLGPSGRIVVAVVSGWALIRLASIMLFEIMWGRDR